MAAGVLLLAGGLYGVAYLTTSKSGLSRAIVWMDADVADYQRFPWRRMEASEDPFLLRPTATIAVFPSRDLVIGRFGIDFGYEDWPGLLAAMARSL